MVFAEVVGTLSFLQPQSDDSMADRLVYYHTSTVLLVTAVLISLKMFGGRPIECFVPAEFRPGWESYTGKCARARSSRLQKRALAAFAELYCWATHTYWVEDYLTIPDGEKQRRLNHISYYAWTPFFLIISAFMSYSPCLIWRILYTKSGIRLKDLMAFANNPANIQPEQRAGNIRGMSAHLSSVFQHRYQFGVSHPTHTHKHLKILNLRFYEAYLTILYLGIKVLYLVNVVFQMFLMNWFLQTDHYTLWGWGVIVDMIRGKLQCVLVVNIFLQKLFVVLWLWYTLLAIITTASLIDWALSTLPFEARKRFVARRLELADVEFRQNMVEADLNKVIDALWESWIAANDEAKSLNDEQPLPVRDMGRRKTSVLVPLVAQSSSSRPLFPGHSPPTPSTPLYGGDAPAGLMRKASTAIGFGGARK